MSISKSLLTLGGIAVVTVPERFGGIHPEHRHADGHRCHPEGGTGGEKENFNRRGIRCSSIKIVVCDAKFGIWAHGGRNATGARRLVCARRCSQRQLEIQRAPQSFTGIRPRTAEDVRIREFKVENWNPEKLPRALQAGGQFFFALANHHDNFDLDDSKYQPWNSVNLGPNRI